MKFINENKEYSMTKDDIFRQKNVGKVKKGTSFSNSQHTYLIKSVKTYPSVIGDVKWEEDLFEVVRTSYYSLPGTKSDKPKKLFLSLTDLIKLGFDFK